MITTGSKCEKCNKVHNREYGSGRFCSKRCARSYSTAAKRKKINKRVSATNKERYKKGFNHLKKYFFKKGFDPLRYSFTTETARLGRETQLKLRYERYKTMPWEELPLAEKKRKILKEQNGKCNHCKLKDWNKKKIVLHFEHKDGNHSNNKRDNIEYICPNCHSQTSTYCFKNKTHTKEAIQKIKESSRKTR